MPAGARRGNFTLRNETARIDGTLVAGTGSDYNDSDWNGSDGKPLPQLWDTAGHYIAGLTQTGAVIEMAFADGDKASIAFVCLPDTVDPRGPKGK